MINKIIDQYKADLGKKIATLQICGDSKFTRALQRRCYEWEIPCAMVCDTDPGYPVVIDREAAFGAHAGLDIDGPEFSDFSACAEGVLQICERVLTPVDTVCIIGRGDAVRGLRRALLEMDATVVVCHSKTKNYHIRQLAEISDVVINAAPIEIWWKRSWNMKQILIDISGSMLMKPDFSSQDVGRLTTAILANRASKMK